MKPLILAGVALASLALAAPVPAQDVSEPAGRYQIAPDQDGFVRLDTETGAMAHCGKRDGAWRCEALAEDNATLGARLDRLSGELSAVDRKLDDMAKRLDGIEAKSEPGFPKEEELDQALNFAERLMQRFFDMVKQFKGEETGQRI